MTSAYRFSLRASLNASTFDDLLCEQNPFGQDHSIIDMCWLSFVTPTALVQLASLCQLLSSSGRRPTLRFMNQQVWRYLRRMQFAESVQDAEAINTGIRKAAL